ncbi:MAG: hypothetical protein IJK56_08545 [Firmicutes bacterium]|nr:hypothetical protein [Bacillota bacterium]
MDNVFIEHMVTKDDMNMRILKKAGMAFGILLFLAAAFLIIPQFFTIALLIAILIVFFFWRKIDREFEYIYTDGNLDVDVIYGKSARKRLLSVDTKEFQFIAYGGSSTYHARIEAKYDKTLDCGAGGIRDNSYVGVIKRGDQTIKLIFEPDERMVEALKRYIPRKFEAKP